MAELSIGGYRPGALGRVVEMHARYYHAHWGFGLYFEREVARELAGFLGRCDDDRDRFYCAMLDDRVVGSITVDGSEPESPADTAHIRWFILEDGHRGQGIGGRLMGQAMAFLASAGYARAYLWTFAGLDAARALYERHGFALAEQREDRQWGTRVLEQRFVWPAPVACGPGKQPI